MELELENVLKYDFYNEKLEGYHQISLETINYLIQFRAFNLISEEVFTVDMEFFTKFYTNLMSFNQEIRYKYANLMDEIFDAAFDGDLRAVYGDYINEVKILDFNDKIEHYETYIQEYLEGLVQILDDLSLSKMFCTDKALLSLLEIDFNTTHQKIERLEETYGEFEDSLDEL